MGSAVDRLLEGPVDRFQHHPRPAAFGGLDSRRQFDAIGPFLRRCGCFAGGDAIGDCRQRIEIGPGTFDPVFDELLQRAIGGRRPGLRGLIRTLDRKRRAKIDQDRDIRCGQHDVAGLDISMQISGAMHMLERVRQGRQQRPEIRQRVAVVEQIGERPAADLVLHP